MPAIETYRPSTQDSLFELFRELDLRYYRGENGVVRWNWRRQKGVFPWFDKLGFPLVFRNNGRVSGLIDALPGSLKLGGKTYQSISVTDFYVRESDGGAGVFLIQKIKRMADICTCTNGPPEVLNIFVQLGFKDVGNGHRAWQKRLIAPGRAVLQKLFSGRQKTAASVNLPDDTEWCKISDLAAVQYISHTFNSLCLRSERSPEFLKWRVLEQPDKNFEIWVLKSPDGEITGYCIFKRILRKIVMPYQAVVYDFGYLDGAAADAKIFVGALERLLAFLGCDVVTFFLISSWAAHLSELGYENVWQDRFLQYSRVKDLQEDTLWHLTLLDTEKFLYLS